MTIQDVSYVWGYVVTSYWLIPLETVPCRYQSLQFHTLQLTSRKPDPQAVFAKSGDFYSFQVGVAKKVRGKGTYEYITETLTLTGYSFEYNTKCCQDL